MNAAVVQEKKVTILGCKDEATDAACSQLGTLKSGVLLRARKALVAAQDSHRLTAPAPVLDAILPLLRALGAVAEDGDKSSATETVALTGSLDQALAYLDDAREARVAAFNEELREDLKAYPLAQGLPELIQSLSISPAGKEDDDKGAFFSASQLLDEARSDCASHGSNSPQMKRARASA